MTAYFICASPRTGGSLLCEALESTGLAGRPQEYFEPTTDTEWFERVGASSHAEYFTKVLSFGSTPNGIFGAKLIWPQFEELTANLRSIHGDEGSDAELLDRTFPGLRYILLTRRDKLRQAISYDRAIRSGTWHAVRDNGHDGPPRFVPEVGALPDFDFERLDYFVQFFNKCDSGWRSFFVRAGAQPLEVVYEDLAGAYESTVLAILRFLEIKISERFVIAAPRLEKLSDSISEEWVRRYRAAGARARTVRQPPHRSYLICSTPRTGSFLLAEALEPTRLAGQPKEYFDPVFERSWCEQLGITTASDYVPKVLAAGSSTNGIFGAKLHWHQLEHLTAKLQGGEESCAPGVDRLRAVFPDLRYVFLTRRDKVRQAVSYYKAIRTGVWFVIRDEAGRKPAIPARVLPFDFETIDRLVAQLTQFDLSWRRYFQGLGVQPFEVVYEDFVGAYESTVFAILRALDLATCADVRVAPPRLVRQADEVSAEWVEHYHALKVTERAG
jgi:trehalose 2-sulfotransferase